MAKCSYNALILCFRVPIGKYKTPCSILAIPSWSLPHCCIGNSNLALTKLLPGSLVQTKTGNLLEPVDVLLQSTQSRLCNWSLWRPLFQKSILLLCCLEPMLRYFRDLTTWGRKRLLTLEKKLPSCGISIFLSMVLIWSIVLISGERPPWMQRILF
jgi:hypothetical protein